MRKLLATILIVVAALMVPTAVRAQNTLTMQAPPGYLIDELRVFDSNSMNPMNSNTYNLGVGNSVTVTLGAPKDTGYNLSVLQTFVDVFTQCTNTELQAYQCVGGNSASCGAVSSKCIASLAAAQPSFAWCSNGNPNDVQNCKSGHNPQACAKLPSSCVQTILGVPGNMGTTNQGACNSNISPVNGKIALSLSCSSGSGTCGCSIQQGQQIASQADKACPFTCQSYNPASHSCVGAPMNGCGTPVRPDPPAPKCPFTCQSYNPASNSCVGAPMNGC